MNNGNVNDEKDTKHNKDEDIDTCVLISSLHLDDIDRIARAQRGLHIADLASTSLAKMKALPSPLVANTGSSFQKRLLGARRNDGVG